MPIYEYYSPDTHRLYTFFAKTIAQAQRVPKCPDHPEARMVKLVSSFAIGGGKAKEDAEATAETRTPSGPDEARLDAAMNAMEREFAHVDENDPRAMARMMRRMAELSGEKFDEAMEDVVCKLEEGADPDSLDDQLGDMFEDDPEATDVMPSADAVRASEAGEKRVRCKVKRYSPPSRDPKLYDFE